MSMKIYLLKVYGIKLPERYLSSFSANYEID